MGGSCALALARAGMRVALFDRGAVCRGASGVNAGTLTDHMVRPALGEHARRGRSMWFDSLGWLGGRITAIPKPGLAVAFTEADEERLARQIALRNAAGARLRLLTRDEARSIEPALSERIRAAALSPDDGTVVSYEFGRLLHAALRSAGVDLRERWPVSGVTPEGGDGFVVASDGRETIRVRRIVLACGAWLEPMLGRLGCRVPVIVRKNQLTVTERVAPFLKSVVTVSDERLSLKQFPNGTAVIGGGWQGEGDPERRETSIIPENLIGNLRLAVDVVPALRTARIVRNWVGLEAETSDGLPILGPIPGTPDAYAIGAVGSGFTSGPAMGTLLAEMILGQTPSLSAFPLDRLVARRS